MAVKKRMRRSQAESKSLILSTALNLIQTDGWAGLSIEKVSQKAGMSPSNVIYHFENRRALLLALLEVISQHNWQIVREGESSKMDSYERLLNHFQKNLKWSRKFPEEAHVILQIYSEASHDPDFSHTFKVMIDRAQGRIAECLHSGLREKLFHFEQDPRLMAKMLHNLLVGAFIYTVGDPDSKTSRYPDSEWHDVFSSVLKMKARHDQTGSQNR